MNEQRPKDVSRYFQNIVIQFSDGSSTTFTGPVVVWDEAEAAKKGGIVDIKFTPPAPLPDGGYWQTGEVQT